MTSKHAVSSRILAKLSATSRPLVKGTQELTPEEIDLVFGGKSLANNAIQGCVNGASAGASTAADGYGLLGAGAGCLAGASAAMAGGGPAAQTAAGWFAGAGFGPYAGSSTDVSAANYENSMNRESSSRRMSNT